jgi:plastocyanin
MRRLRPRRLAVATFSLAAAASLTGVAATSPAATKKKPPVKVSVADFYFGPDAVTIKKGGSVKWVWAAANTEPHDVHLKKGPKGLKNKGTYSTKTTAVTNARFQKTFETPGTYEYICTIHPTQMKMKITVKK